jgi:hypothetical protein
MTTPTLPDGRRASRGSSVRLGCVPVLDPFAGSGTTLAAALARARDLTGQDLASPGRAPDAAAFVSKDSVPS